ncbi:MAG: hypothetical protein PHS34_07655 [Candidatus Omnitrophica bacterium]|nr:hypothetical protein [Candidatus Omnitrophota bacterium]
MADILKQTNFEHAEAVDISSADHTCKYVGVIYVGGGGDAKTIKVATRGGEDVTFTGVQTGSILPVLCSKVYKTGTDATLMVVLS